MKVKILASVILLLTLGACTLNTHFLLRSIDRITHDVQDFSCTEPASDAKERAQALFDGYKRAENFLSLTVSHNDLTDIESFFSEMIGYLSVEDTDGAEMAKSRLIDALAHLRRLSGVNISSIF